MSEWSNPRAEYYFQDKEREAKAQQQNSPQAIEARVTQAQKDLDCVYGPHVNQNPHAPMDEKMSAAIAQFHADQSPPKRDGNAGLPNHKAQTQDIDRCP